MLNVLSPLLNLFVNFKNIYSTLINKIHMEVDTHSDNLGDDWAWNFIFLFIIHMVCIYVVYILA